MFSQFTACSMLTVSTNMGIQAIAIKQRPVVSIACLRFHYEPL